MEPGLGSPGAVGGAVERLHQSVAVLPFLAQQGQDRGADIAATGAVRSLRAFAERAAAAAAVHGPGLGAAAAAATWFALAVVGQGFAVCWHAQVPFVAVAPRTGFGLPAASAFGAFPAVTALAVRSGFFVVLVCGGAGGARA